MKRINRHRNPSPSSSKKAIEISHQLDGTNAEKSEENPSPEVGDISSVTAGAISRTYNTTEKEDTVAAVKKALDVWVDDNKKNNLFPSENYYNWYKEGKLNGHRDHPHSLYNAQYAACMVAELLPQKPPENFSEADCKAVADQLAKAEADCASSKEAYWNKSRIASLHTLQQNVKIYAEIMAAHYSKKLADKK